MIRSALRVSPLLLVAFLSGSERPGSALEIRAGVVIEELAKGSAGEKAGLRAGDVLLAWERAANPPANPEKAEGTVESVFDWTWVEVEQGPRAPVRVVGERDGSRFTVELTMLNWGIQVRPRLNEDALRAYAGGRAAISSKELDKGLALWDSLAESAATANEVQIACWVNLQSGNALAATGRLKEALVVYDAARTLAQTTRNILVEAAVWNATAKAFESQDRYKEAEQAYASALRLREETLGESLSVAASLHSLGNVADSQGERALAESLHARALKIREKLAPDSIAVASSLGSLGNVAVSRDDLATAEHRYSRALTIYETRAPGTLEVAATLNNLGVVAINRGDPMMAAAYHERALAIRERLAPDSLAMAGSLVNLGIVARQRGDLATAESYHRRSLALLEKLAPGSLRVAAALNNLGIVAWKRGELATAAAYHERALTIKEKLAPESLDVAISLHNLGVVARQSGELATAENYLKRALTIQQRVRPDSLVVSVTLTNLGNIALDRKDFAAAEAHYNRALAIHEKLSPESLDVAYSLNGLGIVARERGDLTAAEDYIQRALVMRSRLAPGSANEAESHHALGVVYRKENQDPLAADHFQKSIEALESQVRRLGGSQEAQTGYGARFVDYYRDYIDLLAEQSQPAAAFHILERSRARTLLAMMAERDLVFTADISAELEQERKRIAWEYDQAQAKLARMNPAKDQTQVGALLNQIRELRDRQAQLVERLRQQSPRLASLQYPRPLDLQAAQAALDPGTVLLSYSVGRDKSYVFALRPDAMRVYPLGVGGEQLREEVERFRSLIQRAPLGAAGTAGVLERGRQLYDLLIQPAADTIANAHRVLIAPDGPLHVLPFAALVRGVEVKAGHAERDWQYLVEWKPLHVVVSATVYAELRKAHPSRGEPERGRTLIAFGNPTYPATTENAETAATTQDAVVRAMLTRGFRLTPLPATTTEVKAIAGHYRGTADTYLGDAATEERAKDVAKNATYLHFASHGLLDERFPLNSGLALTIPPVVKEGQDNGILQAWEVFERMRIDADLVVLSACDTGLGKEMGGEGLVGLTRAFQYAGARSVLASLWSVADETTAVLMERFYGYLKAGKSKDAALREAQLDLIRGSHPNLTRAGRTGGAAASHPYYWAAFQLNGDWR
jgi:CHAT domain-containing protein/Tfp pilus assembly protein PilF